MTTPLLFAGRHFAHFELINSGRLQPSGWTTVSERPDELRVPVPWRGRLDRGTGAGRSAEGNDETAGDVEDEVPRFTLYFPSRRGGVQRATPPDRNTDRA
jgi:hypothetical protein